MQSATLQLSLFDQRDMAGITAPEFPGERLVVCRNPDLAAERRRKPDDLLAATGRDLARTQAAVGYRPRYRARDCAATAARRPASLSSSTECVGLNVAPGQLFRTAPISEPA